jgi:hypothetical protein
MGESHLTFTELFQDKNTAPHRWMARVSLPDTAMALDEIERSIHQLELARRILLEAERVEPCPDCILNKVAQVGQ